MKIFGLVIAAMPATPVVADEPVFEPKITEQCLAGNPDPHSCIGTIYSGGTNAGPAGTRCLMRETAAQTLLLRASQEAF